MMARATAHICRSPPESLPASCLRRSAQDRKISNIRACARPRLARTRGRMADVRVLSSTVMNGKAGRLPARGRSRGRQRLRGTRAMSSPSKRMVPFVGWIRPARQDSRWSCRRRSRRRQRRSRRHRHGARHRAGPARRRSRRQAPALREGRSSIALSDIGLDDDRVGEDLLGRALGKLAAAVEHDHALREPRTTLRLCSISSTVEPLLDQALDETG